MAKKKHGKDHTKTTEFEVEGIEEAYAPSPSSKSKPGQPWKPTELPKLQVETPPELQEGYQAKIWILERRANGILAKMRRWFAEKSGKPKKRKKHRKHKK